MSLGDILKTQSKRAIDLLDGINGKGIFTSKDVGTYNTVTDSMAVTETKLTDLTMVKTSLSAKEMEASPITLVSTKFIIASLDMGDVKPKKNDTVEYESELWEIVEVKSPPSNPIWILYCKRK